MLVNFIRPKLDDPFDEHGAGNVWFQQDGATSHTHLVVRSEFSEKCFLGMLSPCVVTSGGRRVRQI
jgi:hypothetical protein